MENQPRRRTFLLVVAVAFLAFCAAAVVIAMVAAGDDDNGEPDEPDTISGPTAGPYFDQLLEFGNELSEHKTELETQLQQGLAAENDEEARLVLLRDNFGETARAYDEFVQALADVSPPAEAAEAHAEMVAAGEDYVATLDDAVRGLEGVETFDEAQTVIFEPAIEERHSDFVDSCAALVNLARGQGAEIAILC